MVVKEYEGRALAAQSIVDMPETSEVDRARYTGRRDAFQLAATTLTEALEKSGAVGVGEEFRRLPQYSRDEGEIVKVTKVDSRPVRIVGRGVASWTCEANLNDPTMYERVKP